MAGDMFSSENLGQSSNFREMKAIYYVLSRCVDQQKQRKVKVFTNNQAAASIVSAGKSKVHLQPVALNIFGFFPSGGITLELQWIPRSLSPVPELSFLHALYRV